MHGVGAVCARTGEPVVSAEKVFLYPGNAASTKAVGQRNAMKTIQVVDR